VETLYAFYQAISVNACCDHCTGMGVSLQLALIEKLDEMAEVPNSETLNINCTFHRNVRPKSNSE
jgi:hypothetical protein